MTAQSQRGMTLPEALISVVLLAIIGVTLLPSVQLASAASHRIDEITRGMSARDNEEQLLNYLLKQMIVSSAAENATHMRGRATGFTFAILGNSNELTSVTMSPLAAGVRLQIGDGREYILFRSLDAPQFSYYGRYTDRQTSGWRFSWEGSRPPQLIRITGAGSSSYEFHLPVQAPLSCAFDPVSRRCRTEG